MKTTSAIALLAAFTGVNALPSANAPTLNIPALLASLGPAPATDPRFTNWKGPGPGDGSFMMSLQG